jgi:hypothetical protein
MTESFLADLTCHNNPTELAEVFEQFTLEFLGIAMASRKLVADLCCATDFRE